MRTFLAEFDSLHAASEHLDATDRPATHLAPIALISPTAQEYLRPASLPRDPDTMMPSIDAEVRLPGWKLLFRSSRMEPGINAAEITPAAEKSLQTGLKNFGRAVPERHRNAMVIRLRLIAPTRQALLAGADMIASDHNFICAAIADRRFVTLAFVPLTVDPPAAMHYAEVFSQLSARFCAEGRLRIIACPTEARNYLPPESRGTIAYLFAAIKRRLRWKG